MAVGEFGLPWPAVLVDPWQLTARFDRPEDLSMHPVNSPEDWDLLLPHPAQQQTLALEPEDGLVLHLGPDSIAPLHLGPTPELGWDETVPAVGRAIVATTNLRDYWRRIRQQDLGTPRFADVFQPDSEAMLVELTAAI